MPLNGSGTYTPPAPEFPAIANTLIKSADFNAIINDVAAALSQAIFRDGQIAFVTDQSMGSFKLRDLAQGVLGTDAVNLAQMQAYVGLNSVYLGGKAVDPTVRNDGSTLEAGDLYFNTATLQLKTWDGAGWLVWPYTDAGLVSFLQTGTGATARTVQSKLREWVSVKDFGAIGDGVTDDTAAIQAAIDSGAYEVRLPYGAYKITASLTIDNKRGFSVVGLGGSDKASIVWAGAAGGIMVEVTRMRQFVMRGIMLVGSTTGTPVAATCLRITSASGNTNTVHTYEDCTFTRVTGRAVDLNGANWQLDMIYFLRCIWSQMDVGVYISGASTFMIHFDGGTMGDFTSYGWRAVTGGTLSIRNMGFIQGGTPGAALVGTPWIVSRARTFGQVTIEGCQHEGNSLFFQGEDDSGGAQTTSVVLRDNTIGPTAGGTYNVIDYRQRGQFIWEGGNIGSSYGTSCLAYFAKPGSPGDGGNIYINGVKNDGTITVSISGNTYITGYGKNGTLQAGNGIKFPATQVASSDANTLDDYEEGTFTPVLYGSSSAGTGTYTQQTGTYTKIGRQVFITLKLGWSAHTGTGNMRISGLPFNLNQGIASVFANGMTYTGTHLQPFIVNNEIWLNQTSSGAADSYIAMDTAVGQLEMTLVATV